MANWTPVKRGDDLDIVGDEWNRVRTAADVVLDVQAGTPVSARGAFEDNFSVRRAWNNTGADLLPGHVARVAGSVLKPTNDKKALTAKLALTLASPGQPMDKLAFVLTRIPNGKFGFARLIGQGVCQVEIGDENHAYAAFAPGVTANLVSADAGPAMILAQDDGLGLKECFIQFPAGGGGGAAGEDEVVMYASAETGGKAKVTMVRATPEASDVPNGEPFGDEFELRVWNMG